MRIPQQTAHKGAEPVPLTDKLGSGMLDGFGFKEHAQNCPVNVRNMDNLFFGSCLSLFWDHSLQSNFQRW
jgi:hypothetical protein